MWFKTLQFYTQCLGGWRKRRKALGNIMIAPNALTEGTESETQEGTDNSPTEGASALPASEG